MFNSKLRSRVTELEEQMDVVLDFLIKMIADDVITLVDEDEDEELFTKPCVYKTKTKTKSNRTTKNTKPLSSKKSK